MRHIASYDQRPVTRRSTTRLVVATALAIGSADATPEPTAPPAALATQVAPGPAVLAATSGRELTVMTRNLYLGGDLLIVAAPGTQPPIPVRVAQLWQQIVASNFPQRAGVIAREIEAASPHFWGCRRYPSTASIR